MCRFLAVSDGFVNLIPTDVRGCTRNRTPQQIINVLTIGNPNGIGGFFPSGLVRFTAILLCLYTAHPPQQAAGDLSAHKLCLAYHISCSQERCYGAPGCPQSYSMEVSIGEHATYLQIGMMLKSLMIDRAHTLCFLPSHRDQAMSASQEIFVCCSLETSTSPLATTQLPAAWRTSQRRASCTLAR